MMKNIPQNISNNSCNPFEQFDIDMDTDFLDTILDIVPNKIAKPFLQAKSINKTAEVKKKQLELQYEFENHQLDTKINALYIQKKYDTLQSYIYLYNDLAKEGFLTNEISRHLSDIIINLINSNESF